MDENIIKLYKTPTTWDLARQLDKDNVIYNYLSEKYNCISPNLKYVLHTEDLFLSDTLQCTDLSDLSNIKWLRFRNLHISKLLTPPNVEHITFSNCVIDSSFINHISNIGLISLTINRSSLDDICIHNSKKVSMSSNLELKTIIFSPNSAVQTLNISLLNITSIDFSNCHNLTHLSIYYSGSKSIDISGLSKLKNLSDIDIQGLKVDYLNLNNPNIKNIRIHSCEIPMFLHSLPIEKINIKYSHINGNNTWEYG